MISALISSPLFLSTSAIRLVGRSTDHLFSSLRQHKNSRSSHRFVSTSKEKPRMFTYDGIRSQLEWNSTLSPTKAPQPTAETKFLRKVPLSSPTSTDPSTRLMRCLDRDHRDDRYEIIVNDREVQFSSRRRSQHQHRRKARGSEARRRQCWLATFSQHH